MVARALVVMQMLPELESGGVERGTVEVARALVAAGHTSVVVSAGGRLVERLQVDGTRHVTMARIGEKSPRCLVHLPRLRRLLAGLPVDVLHLRSRLPAWVGYLAARSLPPERRPAVVTTFHGFYSINAYSAVMAKGDPVIAISNQVADHVHSVYRVPRRRIRRIYRGIDEAVFDPRRVDPLRVDRAAAHLGLSRGPEPVILMPARFTRLKGHLVLIDALARLAGRRWQAVCVGAQEPKSGFFRQLVQRRRRAGLEGRVRFAPTFDDMPAALALADIVVSATVGRPEAFGRVAVEAGAMEKAMVATAHGGSLETVRHGTTGLLVPPDDAAALAAALARLLDDGDLRRRLGQAARPWVLRRFTLGRMCAQTLDVYRQAAARLPA